MNTSIENMKNEAAYWYMVHTYSGQEDRVKKNLELRVQSLDMTHKIDRIIVPKEKEITVKGGKRKDRERNMFPGYILIHLSLDDESYFLVKNTPGVTGFVSHEEEDGNRQTPVPLTDKEVNTILNKIEERQEELKLAYKIGETVRITAGPFSDFIGTVHEVQHNRGKVTVMVSFFGRETPVELDLLQAEPT